MVWKICPMIVSIYLSMYIYVCMESYLIALRLGQVHIARVKPDLATTCCN